MADQPPVVHSNGIASSSDLHTLSTRLDAIELAQSKITAQLEEIKTQLAASSQAIPAPVATPDGASIEELQKKVAELAEGVKLDQERLYARLHNARAVGNKMSVKVLPTANGKPPPNFPATRGEYEHITKERYEAILKAYNQPIKGDTDAKREALRVFLGLPETLN